MQKYNFFFNYKESILKIPRGVKLPDKKHLRFRECFLSMSLLPSLHLRFILAPSSLLPRLEDEKGAVF